MPLVTRFAVALALAAGLAAAGRLAQAGERDATRAEAQRVVQHLGKLGYRSIRDVDVVRSTYVVDAISPRGREVDVILDRSTLRILRETRS